MQSINGIASIEIQESLYNAVEELDIATINDLLYRFSFNEDFFQQLSINVLQKNVDLERTNIEIALILLNKTGKQTKEDFLNYMKQHDVLLFEYFCERVDI